MHPLWEVKAKTVWKIAFTAKNKGTQLPEILSEESKIFKEWLFPKEFIDIIETEWYEVICIEDYFYFSEVLGVMNSFYLEYSFE